MYQALLEVLGKTAANRLINKVHALLVYLLVEGDSLKIIRSLVNGQMVSSATVKNKAERGIESAGGRLF